MARLRQFGYRIVEPEEGLLASGMTGKGRLAKLERILEEVVAALASVEPSAISRRTVEPAAAAVTVEAAPSQGAPVDEPAPAQPAATDAFVEPVALPRPEPRIGLTVMPVTRPAIELATDSAIRPAEPAAQQEAVAARVEPAARQEPVAARVEPVAARQAPARTDLSGLHVVVTAGGTAEPIDPVRFVGNRSSGKMGVAIAQAALDRGAAVTLIIGNASVEPPADALVARAETAAEMQAALLALTPPTGALFDVLVMAAAVADFRPRTPAERKLSRADGLALELEATPDLLAETADRVRTGSRASGTARPVLVGFAAETGSFDRVRQKLKSKGVDLLVANDVSEAGSGFRHGHQPGHDLLGRRAARGVPAHDQARSGGCPSGPCHSEAQDRGRCERQRTDRAAISGEE